MINIMLVAGNKTEKLNNFLQQKGTFSIDYAYRSLAEDIVNIRDSIISVDKMVYLLDDQIINIRTEMRLLKELLIDGGFFTVKEIVFLVTKSVDVDKAVRYFKAVMAESSYTNYVIHKTPEKISFAEIFEYIVGISGAENHKNVFRDVYRVERHSDSDVAYMSSDNSDMEIEPFSYERAALYNIAKENSRRSESGIMHKDSLADNNIRTFKNINLGDLQMVADTKDIKTIVVTGDRKTGVSTWASALAVSAVSAGETVTLIDFTDNCDIKDILKSNEQMFYYVRMLEMMHSYNVLENSINLVTTFNEQERSVRMEFLQHIFTNRNSVADICIIALPSYLFDDSRAILVNENVKYLYCINPIVNDIIVKQEKIAEYSEMDNFLLVLNNRMSLMDNSLYLDKDGIEGLLPFDLKIIQAIDFDSLNIDEGLFISLMGV